MQQNNQSKKVLLKITDLKQWFPIKKTKLFQKEQLYVRANDGITLDIYEGETVGLVGESGCGKSTFGRTLLQLYPQTEGKTMYYGRTLWEMAPDYVEHTVKNIVSRKKKIRELEQKTREMRAEYEMEQRSSRSRKPARKYAKSVTGNSWIWYRSSVDSTRLSLLRKRST